MDGMSVYTKRVFGKKARAGLPLGAALPKINSRVSGVQLGVQSYSFRDRPQDAAIQAMVEDGIGECELYSPHIELGGLPHKSPVNREELRKWRLTVPMEEIKAVRKKFDDPGIWLFAFNYSFRDDFTDPEIERGFQ